MDPAQALKRTALFGDLDSADLDALAARAVERRLTRGEILFTAGDPAGGLYVVVEGAIRAYRVNAEGREQTGRITIAADGTVSLSGIELKDDKGVTGTLRK